MAKEKADIFIGEWFPWYAEKALTSEEIDGLTLAEEGAYRRAIDKAWLKGSLPATAEDLAAVIGKKCTVKIAERILKISHFRPMPGNRKRVVHTVLERIRAEQREKSEKKITRARNAAGKRWEAEANKYGRPDAPSNAQAMLSDANRTEQNRTDKKEEIKHTQEAADKPPPVRELFIGTVTAGLQKRMDLKTLPSKIEWQQQAEWAHVNGFTADQFLECYDLLKRQHWRDGPVKPKHIAENLPNLSKLRTEIQNQNGSVKQPVHQQPVNEMAFQKMLQTQGENQHG